MAKKVPLPVPDPKDALKAFENLVSAWKDYKTTAELEQTKRESIRAWRDVQVKAIEKNTEILKLYLDHSFAERRMTIDQLFQRLDAGIGSSNPELISMALQSIITITRESPLAGAAQLLSSMNNPEVKQLEI